jgi:RHS repeat-associated protein
VVEIQAFGTSAGGETVQWLVPDHLGTPRIIVDETGSRANVKRHDYLPFGEELFAGSGGRSAALGYAGDGVRQQFTEYERDNETTLDYAEARFYSSIQGRFTSIDPLMGSAAVANPQTFNRYSYVTNSPLTRIDPTGLFGISPGGSQLGGIGGLQAFSLNNETNQDRTQTAQSAGPAPAPSAEPQVPSSVTVTVIDPMPIGNLPLDANTYFSGMGARMEFTFLDQNGVPMTDITVTEAVTPATTVQNSNPVLRPDGKVVDLIGRGSFGPQLSNTEARAQAADARNKPNAVVQSQVMTVMSSTGQLAVASHQRILTNVDGNGQLRPVVTIRTAGGTYLNNYTFSYTRIELTAVRTYVCPSIFR